MLCSDVDWDLQAACSISVEEAAAGDSQSSNSTMCMDHEHTQGCDDCKTRPARFLATDQASEAGLQSARDTKDAQVVIRRAHEQGLGVLSPLQRQHALRSNALVRQPPFACQCCNEHANKHMSAPHAAQTDCQQVRDVAGSPGAGGAANDVTGSQQKAH